MTQVERKGKIPSKERNIAGISAGVVATVVVIATLFGVADFIKSIFWIVGIIGVAAGIYFYFLKFRE